MRTPYSTFRTAQPDGFVTVHVYGRSIAAVARGKQEFLALYPEHPVRWEPTENHGAGEVAKGHIEGNPEVAQGCIAAHPTHA
jgi:hypothetical protein